MTPWTEIITNGVFHLIYVAQEKWFHGRPILFRLRCRDETIGDGGLAGGIKSEDYGFSPVGENR